MARVSILDRFRPVGAPGLAGPAAVPADDVRGPASELDPLFAAIAPVVAECSAAVDAARAAADMSLAEARNRAATLVEQARVDAEAERVGAATRTLGASAHDDEAVLDAAQQTARALRDVPKDAMATTVDDVIARVISNLLAE